MNLQKMSLVCLLAVACILMFTGCVVVKHNPNYQQSSRSYQSSSSAYWYYYPESRVYYHVTQHYYYYPVNGGWRKAKQLPPGWMVNSKDRVRIRIAGVPYTHHDQHFHKYPPRKVTKLKQLPWGQKQNNVRQQDAKIKHPVHQEHPGNRFGNTNRPEHAAKGNVNKNRIPPGPAMKQDGKPGNGRQDRGNSNNAPGKNRQPKGLAKHGQDKPSHRKNADRNMANKGHGNSQQAKNHGKPEKKSQVKSAKNNGHGKATQKHQNPGQDKTAHGKPQKIVAKPEQQNDRHQHVNPNQSPKKVAQPANHGPANKGDNKTAKSDRKEVANKGKRDNFKSHKMEQANTQETTDSRSDIAVKEQKPGNKKQANKGSGKKQASITKGQTKKSNSAGKNNKHSDSAADNEGDDTPGNAGANKGKGKGR